MPGSADPGISLLTSQAKQRAKFMNRTGPLLRARKVEAEQEQKVKAKASRRQAQVRHLQEAGPLQGEVLE